MNDEVRRTGEPDVSALPRRLLDTVLSPGKMVAEVAVRPKWVGALAVSALLIAISAFLIPQELVLEVQRRVALERGLAAPELTERARGAIRVISIAGPPLALVIVAFLLAGLYTFVFTLVLGDEGKYRQYLAVFAHAAFVPALAALPLTPLRIATHDPSLSLNVGSFFFFLEPGYLLNVFRAMDLTHIWAALIVALGAHAIDPRRSFASAAVILLCLSAAFALIMGGLLPR